MIHPTSQTQLPISLIGFGFTFMMESVDFSNFRHFVLVFVIQDIHPQALLALPLRKSTLKEMVVMFLYTIAHNHTNRVLQKRFGWSGETISRHIHRVLRAILRLAPILHCEPQTVPESCDEFRWKHFEGCLGAIDGTHIQVRAKMVDQGMCQ
ncbi:hypothetical protein LINGRAHAP2_LOCUS28002 [Linum grandiflorum]